MPAGFGFCPPAKRRRARRLARAARAFPDPARCGRTRGLNPPLRADRPSEDPPPDRGARWLFAALLALLLAPSVWLDWLPTTDLPQHVAAAAMLLHPDDPRLGFAAWYAPDWGRSLYLLPYFAMLALSPFVSLETGMRVVVVISLALLPLATLALLRALRKPEWLALLSLPLVYNRAFFWGFVNFQLALGLALLALAILVRPPRGVRSELALAALCALVAITHPYGLLFLVGCVGLWLLLGDRRALARHALGLAPLALGLLAWGLKAGRSAGASGFIYGSLLERLDDFEESVLGGYRDTSEAWLLLGFLIAWGWLAARALPYSRERWRALAPAERVLWAFMLVNLILFASLPTATSLVGEIPMRHAVIAMSLLPALADRGASLARARSAVPALVALALVTIAVSWTNLIRFDREARGFSAVIEQVPYGSRIVALTWDANGEVMRTHPYWHFAAWVQTRRGGLITHSFPFVFWNLPVRAREDAGVPDIPGELFAKPQLFDYQKFGRFYDIVLVRTGRVQGVERFPVFPYELAFEAPPWQVWRAR